MSGRARKHLKEVLGFALALLLLFGVLHTSNLGKVVAGIRTFPLYLAPLLFTLVALREAVRVVEWRLLLQHLGIAARWRRSTLALLVGDAGQIVPGGIYASNAVLKQEEDANVARSLSATMAMQLLESFLCLVILSALGVSGWPWLRPVAIVVLLGFLGFLALVTSPPLIRWLDERAGSRRLVVSLVDGLKQFLQGIQGLLSPPLLLKATGLAAAHLIFTIAALYVIVLGLGLMHISPLQVAAVYAFVLAVINLNPLPTDVGVSEGSGITIFAATGVPQAQGLMAMLLVRFAIIGSTAILLGLALVRWHNELGHLTEGPRLAEPAADESRVVAEGQPPAEDASALPTSTINADGPD
ncbi:MAG TPA: lysylphosphatidylglycerol synthase transmembrane domain-containing protein [Chloroflexota bacterium]|nr:lysylphosphatidylglycerol synthase transmembrane domain-containing protein [Chloroflexota bacterium]